MSDLLKILTYVYLIGFAAASYVIYSRFIIKAKSPLTDNRDTNNYLFVIMSSSLVIRLFLAAVTQGHPIDISCFKGWSSLAASDLSHFYNNASFVDYPPLYVYVMFVLGKLAGFLNVYDTSWAYSMLIKLPSIIADMVTAYILFKLTRSRLAVKQALLICIIYLMNPVILLNSSVWGQVDSFLTMLLAAGLYLVSYNKIIPSSIMFAAALLLKPQGIILLPVLLFELVRRRKFLNFVISFAAGLSTVILVVLPFSFSQKPLWILDLYFKTADGYKYATINAYNLFALSGANWKPDSSAWLIFDYSTWGYIFLGLIVIFTAFLYYRSKGSEPTPLISAVFINTAVFMLSSRMHERYMFPVLALLLMVLVYTRDKRILPLYLSFTATGFINTFEVYLRALRENYWVPADDITMLLVSALNILFFAYLVIVSLDITGGKILLFGKTMFSSTEGSRKLKRRKS